MNTKNYFLIIYLLVLTVSINKTTAQEEAFNCDYNAYLFQYNDVYAIDLASGTSYEVATDVTPGNINAAAYNPADGFIWGSLSTPQRTIVKIGKNFNVTTYEIPELPSNNRYVGDISQDGIYYLKGGGTTYYKIDLNPESSNYTQYIESASLSQGISIHDWAFNAVDNMLYAVEKGSNKLYRIDPSNGLLTNLGEVPILSGLTYTYGAVYFDAAGRFYVSANQTGTVFVIYDVQDLSPGSGMSSNLFAYGPSSASNDGARCPTAPVLQEICNNGIDDDGDGLTDCEDPACSGVSNCPEFETSSSGNDGGLESNSRLSSQISKRNFKRVKEGLTFQKQTAKRLLKTSSYATRTRSSNIQLSNFVPLGIIENAEVIESTPEDLIGITNATDILAVDYDQEGNTVAAMLILKTEDAVYEHTKYICDRLLGAELLNVSTMEINGYPFIRSIIKNPNGSVEFVLSLSAKEINNGQEFAIESHWNLDRYEANKGFYNFQIWASSIDDLAKLAEEVISLLEVQKPINEYKLSNPPKVFVKKGAYTNGKLNLEITNTNGSEQLLLEGGISRTETSELEYIQQDLLIEKELVNQYTINTGALFDFGFRITNENNDTPDDIFMSDGPWGTDESAGSTTVTNFKVSGNSANFNPEGFLVARNIELLASTAEYVSVYRAFTPRFKAVDLSDFNAIQFAAEGTGELEVTLVKEGINEWESQFRTKILLSEVSSNYVITYDQLSSSLNDSFDATDLTSMVFAMVSENGQTLTKRLRLEDVAFVNASTSEEIIGEANEQAFLAPNPAIISTSLYFNTDIETTMVLRIFSIEGREVMTKEMTASKGKNEMILDTSRFNSGIYFCMLEGGKKNTEPLRLIIQ